MQSAHSTGVVVLDALAHAGFIKLSASYTEADFVGLARALGEVVDDTPVRVVAGKRTYLASPGAIPLHTDHPMADLIAWRCDSQDARDGASLLVDGRDVIARLGRDVRTVLTRTLLPAMVRLGDVPSPTAILSDEEDDASLFFAPWLEPVQRRPESQDALVELRRELATLTASSHAVRLEPGDVLVVDNHRMLHGRGTLLPESTRRLRRLWIRRRDECAQRASVRS